MFKVETLASRNIWNSADIQSTNVGTQNSVEPGYTLSFDGTGWNPTNPYQIQNVTGSSISNDNSNVIIFSPSTYTSTYVLENPIGEYINKLLLLGNNTSVQIQTNSGTLNLTPDYSSAQLLFNGEKWLRYSSPPEKYQFYPSRLHSEFYGSGYANRQGTCVSISGDGNTLVTGAPNDNESVGACFVFSYNADTGLWTQQQKLVGSGYVYNSYQGCSVSISSDGNTIASGAQLDNEIGAVWIFTNNNGVWTQQGEKLVPNDYIVPGSVAFGYSVSLSSDGNTLIASAPNNNFIGSVWNFQRTSDTWAQVGSFISPNDASESEIFFGNFVSVSADGTIFCAGAPFDTIGASWIFKKIDNVWYQQGTKLQPNDGVGPSFFGWQVSLSANGNTVAISGPTDQGAVGATWIFNRTGDTWTQAIPKLIGMGAPTNGNQGLSICLSSDGNVLVVGQNEYEIFNTQAYVFTCVNGVWKQRPGYLNGPISLNWFFVSIDTTGDRTAFSGDGFNDGTGSICIFI